MPLASPGKHRYVCELYVHDCMTDCVGVGVSGPYHYSDRTDQEETKDQGKVWPVSCLSLFEKIGVPVWLAVADSTEDRYRQGQLS